MSRFIHKGPIRGFQGLKVERDSRTTTSRATNRQQIPIIDSLNLPPATLPGIGGGLAYDVTTRRPYYSDGFTWHPIGGGAPGTVESYSFLKDNDQFIPLSIETALSHWETTSSDTYHSLDGWNLATGIYTSSIAEVITLHVNISWASGVSNLGTRIMRIQHMKLGIPVWTTVKESATQADPDIKRETTQEVQIHLRISQGDAVRIVVFHDAPIPIPILGGVTSSVAGFKVQIT